MGPISLWASAVVIPGTVWVFNLLVRVSRRDLVITAGADWLLLLLVFDLTAGYSLNEFIHFVKYIVFRDDFIGVLSVLGCLALLTWGLIVLYLERLIVRTRRRRRSVTISEKLSELYRNPKKLVVNRVVGVILISAVLISTTGIHVLAFIWPGPG
jgi:hypothetical protein